MGENAAAIEAIVRRYCEQLEILGIHPGRVLLYGSRLKGNAEEGSDIDLVVVSQGFARYSSRERLELLGIAAARILEPIQAVGFTPDEIEGGEILPFWQDIISRASEAA